MSAKPFLDTNVLVYAFVPGDARSGTAKALLAAGGVVSVQVLSEFVNVAHRKLRRDWDEIEEALGILRTLLGPPLPLTAAIHGAAVAIARRHGFRFYDGLILAAALEAGCTTLFTEDLQHGQAIGTLSVRNPFAA